MNRYDLEPWLLTGEGKRTPMQLGKLDVSQETQRVNSKTVPNGAQCDQQLTSKKQNATLPTATPFPKTRSFGKWGDAFSIMRDVTYGKLRYMDLYEQTTLAFIWGRTQYYGKAWEFIPLRHFMSGVWGRDGLCVAPRIRISETKLLQSIKGLEAKNIIEVNRTFRKNRYRIRTEIEIDTPENTRKIWEHIIFNQPGLLGMMVGEMEDRKSLLDESELEQLVSFREIIQLHQTGAILNGTLRDEVNATSPVGQGSLPTTSPVKDHKLPIISKIKKPNLAPAPPKTRRLPIRSLASKGSRS
jgi:hypothetical protein